MTLEAAVRDESSAHTAYKPAGAPARRGLGGAMDGATWWRRLAVATTFIASKVQASEAGLHHSHGGAQDIMGVTRRADTKLTRLATGGMARNSLLC